jgi:hypothetical protein
MILYERRPHYKSKGPRSRESERNGLTDFLVAEFLCRALNKEPASERLKEHFFVLGLTVDLKILFLDLIGVGSLTSVLVHPREVFRSAIVKGAARVILGHNHPSGDPAPSKDDIALTNRVIQAGELLGIPVIEHLIIGEGFRSMAGYHYKECQFGRPIHGYSTGGIITEDLTMEVKLFHLRRRVRALELQNKKRATGDVATRSLTSPGSRADNQSRVQRNG